MSRHAVVAACSVIALAAFAAYANSFRGVFTFDDQSGIVRNASIRHLSQLADVLRPPFDEGQTVGGRPLLNFTFAVNYALGHLDVRGYHAVNLLIHVLAGCTLLGLIRRTAVRVCPTWTEQQAIFFALAVALLWTLHPLQTAAVTYISQRAESLAAWFVLVALYAFVRAVETPSERRWPFLAVLSCFCGAATKETVAMAPLLVLAYDRCFVAGSLRSALRQHGRLHLALASSWLLTGMLMLSTAGRGNSAGFGTDITWWQYALTQCAAVPHYLRLAIWPAPLVLDYGTSIITDPAKLVLPAVVLALLLGGAVVAWQRRWPVAAFAGFAFFVLLAPSSSIVPVATQTMAEHRMYLPLAAVIVLGVAGLHRLAGAVGLGAVLVIAVILGVVTAQRNLAYKSAATLWADIIAKRPENPRGWCGLGLELLNAGRPDDARLDLLEALRLKPDYHLAHFYLARALVETKQFPEAETHFAEAIRLDPRFAEAHFYFGNFLVQRHEFQRAVEHYEQAVAIRPDYLEAECNLGFLLTQLQRQEEGWRHLAHAVQLAPESVLVRGAFAETLLKAGRVSEALPHLNEIVRLQPGHAESLTALGAALAQLGRNAEARRAFEEALRMQPGYTQAQTYLDRLNQPDATGPGATVINPALSR